MRQFIRVLAAVAVAVASGGSGSSCIAAEALPKLPEGVRAEFDIPYAATDNPRQQLDLYLPTRITEKGGLPLLVFIHGGGWRAGSKRAGAILLPLVQSGEYAIASVGYRFTDEAIWPCRSTTARPPSAGCEGTPRPMESIPIVSALRVHQPGDISSACSARPAA